MQTADPANLFRTDAELDNEDARRHKAARLKHAGSPIELAGKPLAMLVRDDHVWTAESGGVLRRTHLDTGKTLQLYKGHTGPVSCFAFSGAVVITGSWDNTIKVWDTKTKELLSTTKAHKDFVKTLLVIPSLCLLASGSADKTIRFWDLSNPKWASSPLKSLGSLSAHTRPVQCLAADENSFTCTRLFSADSMGVIKVWRLERRYGPQANCRGTLESELKEHNTGINSMWYGEGLVWSASTDCSVRLHAYPMPTMPAKKMPTITHPGSVRCLLPLPLTELAESYIITGSGDMIRAYDVSAIEEPELLGEIDAHAHDVTSLSYWVRRSESESGKPILDVWIVSGSLDGTLRKWQLKNLLSRVRRTREATPPKEAAKVIVTTAEEDRELEELLSSSGSDSYCSDH